MQQDKQQGIAKVQIAGKPFVDPVTRRLISNAGMGIIVDSRHIITCAHVINEAMRRLDDNASQQPDAELKVSVVFPFVDGTELSGNVIVWRATNNKPVGDVAVIELDTDAPENAGVAKFATGRNFDTDSLNIYGFKAGGDEGNHVQARFMGKTGEGRVQVDGINTSGFFIEGGYSGAAVWDMDCQAVVGMITSRSTDRANRVAYMIPTSALEEVWPTLLVNHPPRHPTFTAPDANWEQPSPGWPELFVREFTDALGMSPQVADKSKRLSIIDKLPIFLRNQLESDSGLDELVRTCASEGQIPRLIGIIETFDRGSTWVRRIYEILHEINSGVLFLPSLRRETLRSLSELPLDDAELYRLAGIAAPGESEPAGRVRLLDTLAWRPRGDETELPAVVAWLERVATRADEGHQDHADHLRSLAQDIWTALNRSAEDFERLIEKLSKTDFPPDEGLDGATHPVAPPDISVPMLPNPQGIFFVPWSEQSELRRGIEEVVRPWLRDPEPRPLILVPHFAPDVTDTLLAVEAICRANGRRDVRLVSGAGFERLRTSDGRGYSDRRKLVFLIDLTGLDADVLARPADSWRNDLLRLCGPVGPSSRRVVVVLHRAMLSITEVYRMVDDVSNAAFVAAPLFSPDYELRQPLGKDGDMSPALVSDASIASIFERLLRVNSTALPRAVLAESEVPRDSFDRPDVFPIWSILRTARRLARAGFFEPAYRLELFCRTHQLFQDSIGLSGDLLPLRDDAPQVVGFVETLDELPGLMPRSVLTGSDGSGRTFCLERMAHWWALPRGTHRGIPHPSWLPVPVQYTETSHDPAFAIKADFASQGRLTLDLPFRSEELDAHIELSRRATPENLRWIVNSPVLYLVDGIRPQHAQAGGWLDALHRRSAPESGLVVSWDKGREPRAQPWATTVFGRGIRARLRPMSEIQVRSMVRPPDDPELLCQLLGMIGRPITEAIRNPSLCALVHKAIQRGEAVRDWSLYDILAADVRLRVGTEPDREVVDLVGNWLPAVALAQREGNPIPVNDGMRSLATELGLIRAGGALRFAYSMLRDFFAARAIAKDIERANPPNFSTFLDRVQNRSTDNWGADWTTPLRILAGMRPMLRDPLIRELATRDMQLALSCAQEIPEAEARALTSDIAKQLADRMQQRFRIPRDSVNGYGLASAAADAKALGVFDTRVSRDNPWANLTPHEIPSSKPFRIGRFPVTNLEFERFVAARGYEERDFWTATSWEWIRAQNIHFPRYWRHGDLNRPNSPVVGVSLYEATAYCRWLETIPLREGERDGHWWLPSPEQWDCAFGIADSVLLGVLRAGRLRGADSQIVSDAEINHRALADVTAQLDRLLDANLELLNPESMMGSAADGIGTLPVGLFAPNEFGCHDLIGLAWEWCIFSPDEFEGSVPAPVKGGPLRSRLSAIWSVFGGGFDPRTRFHQIGFRVCNFHV